MGVGGLGFGGADWDAVAIIGVGGSDMEVGMRMANLDKLCAA